MASFVPAVSQVSGVERALDISSCSSFGSAMGDVVASSRKIMRVGAEGRNFFSNIAPDPGSSRVAGRLFRGSTNQIQAFDLEDGPFSA